MDILPSNKPHLQLQSTERSTINRVVNAESALEVCVDKRPRECAPMDWGLIAYSASIKLDGNEQITHEQSRGSPGLQ